MVKNKKTAAKKSKPKVSPAKQAAIAALDEAYVKQVAKAKPTTKKQRQEVRDKAAAVVKKRAIKKVAAPAPVVVEPPNTPPFSRLVIFIESPLFARIFLVASAGILLLTTLFWTVLSARLHQGNADQLIDAYLFENGRTFQEANFPGAHSFLLKWPVFALMSLYGNSPDVFLFATILMVLTTVGALVYLLSKIERRPAVLGLLCLALSSILLLVPAQPYAGALLPVNMAMTTTRNLEYVLYILALYYAVRLPRLKSWLSLGIILAIGLAAASDKLFAILALGGVILALVWYYGVLRRPAETKIMGRWFVLAVFGTALSVGFLYLLNRFGITHIVQEQTASPYPLIHSVSQLALGMIYGVGAILTNFGANPVHSIVIAKDIPHALVESLRHLSIVGYGVNFLLLAGALYATIRLFMTRLSDNWTRLSVLLVGSTLTAGAVFVLTDHYYPVDARYLTIGLFALSIAAATYLRNIRLQPRYVVAVAAVLLAVVPIGLLANWDEFQASDIAMLRETQATARVSDELQRRKISRLAGNYWDITPVKGADKHKLTIMPVDNCSTPAPALSSSAWYDSPAKTPAAYLAVKDTVRPSHRASDAAQSSDIATYDGCSLAHLVGTYGNPTDRVIIRRGEDAQGAKARPDVLLLLYANGVHLPGSEEAAKQAAAVPSPPSVDPAPEGPMEFVPFTDRDGCPKGTTVQMIAHQDDDLLFMNPDLIHSIKEGRCIRTVYLTAGDAGEDIKYWGQRELGAKAAYAQMYGVKDEWHEELQMLRGQKVSVNYLKDEPRVALVFLRLPDGNLRGNGFAGHGYESLSALLAGRLSVINSVDGSAKYTTQELQDALLEILVKDLPDQIRTQASANLGDGDHADHHAVGTLADRAAAAYLQTHTVAHYVGYPGKERPVNLSDDDITLKQASFLTYAKFDGAVCQSAYECQQTYTYGRYLTRQYQP